jgi:hypothetical protein
MIFCVIEANEVFMKKKSFIFLIGFDDRERLSQKSDGKS